MEILFGLFIIVLIVILVKVFRSKPEQTEPVQLSNPAHERNMILLAEVKRQAEDTLQVCRSRLILRNDASTLAIRAKLAV